MSVACLTQRLLHVISRSNLQNSRGVALLHSPFAQSLVSTMLRLIPAGVMRKKRQEFMDLKQAGRSVHDYSKQFNYLAQYAPDQVDTDEKKKDRFMIGLSTKLQERLALNTGGTFPEFVSNIMIADDTIRKPRRGRLWLLHLVVLLQSTGQCTTTVLPIHLNPSTSISVRSSSGLPAHLSVSTSGKHLRLYLHLRL
jgi:hypothetical protein